MDPQLQSLRFWHDLITFYALLLGIEGPVLLWVGTYRERPRFERALSLVPALFFGWGTWSAKLINDQLVNAASALAWGHAHYPTFPVTVDAEAAVAAAAHTGWTFGAVATLLLIGGWVLVLRWSQGQGLPARKLSSRSRLPGAPLASTVRQTMPVEEALDDESDEGIEITIERMDD